MDDSALIAEAIHIDDTGTIGCRTSQCQALGHFFFYNENLELAGKSQDSPHDEYPLKLGNSALLVGVAVVVELLALALVLELAPLGAVAVEDTVGNVDGGTSVADPHAVDVSWQTMSKRMGSIVQQRFSDGNLEEPERTS